MLVLTRRVGIQHQDTIVIGTDIEITVVEVKGDQVRIGIQAPRHVTVHRTEIYEQIQQENRAAASASPSSVPRTNPRPSSRS